MKTNKLSTFIFVQGDRTISPPLVTVREYARWLETVFDEYTCNYELYLRATIDGQKVLEFHPGTRIGQYFDKTEFIADKYSSWYIYQDSQMMKRINKMKMAEYKDIAPILSGDKKGLRLLRLYTIDQVELYVRTKIDKTFYINDKFLQPKKIVLRKCDMKYLIMPEHKSSRKSLLDSVVSVPMTVQEIEQKLGHRVSIISHRGGSLNANNN